MKTHRLSLAGLALLSLVGCSGKIQMGTFGNYPVQYQEQGLTGDYPRNLTIYSVEKDGGKVYFEDSNNDRRFNSITLQNVRNGNPVEKLASLEVGQRIASSFAEVEEE